ncbi:MAG: hypothetical protein HW373_1074, partial [Deltaproteobacteria bacterium]|nr:hypothetical protein [Deltaproteobacteria bacterium]
GPEDRDQDGESAQGGPPFGATVELGDRDYKSLLVAGADPALREALNKLYVDSAKFKVSSWWLFWFYILCTLGELCLSPRIIHRMGFERVGREAYVLADGQIVRADIHKAEILWFNHRRSVEVIALDNPRGLLGTQLLQGCRLTVQFGRRKVSINQERR